LIDVLEQQKLVAEALLRLYKPLHPITTSDTAGLERKHVIQQYLDIMNNVQTTVTPELHTLDNIVIQPTLQLLQILKNVERMMDKRKRKRLDYDRHQDTLRTLTHRRERSLGDERKLQKAQTNTNEASVIFQEINDKLKRELPILLRLRERFIIPCFQSFYTLQLKISRQIYEQLCPLLQLQQIDHTTSALQGYEARRQQVDSIFEQIKGIGGQGK
jgi:amphiphysin